MKKLLILFFVLVSGASSAEENINVCYNYSCKQEETARFSEEKLRTLAKKFRSTSSATDERKVLAEVIGMLYYWAGQQTPVYADNGGNFADEAVNGSMDCIDHSTTTTRFLKMLEHRRMLKYHEVEEVVRRRRFLMFEHYSAAITELPRAWLTKQGYGIGGDVAKPNRYVVDSWFVNNGEPAVILPLEDWMGGAGPEVEPRI